MDKKKLFLRSAQLVPLPSVWHGSLRVFWDKDHRSNFTRNGDMQRESIPTKQKFWAFFFSSLNFYGKTFSVKVVAVVILHTQLNLEASKINSLKVSEFNYIFNCWPFKYFFELSRKKSRSKTCRGYDRQTGPWVSFYFSNFFLEFWHFEICKENGACFDLFLDLTEKSLLNESCKGH